jgi:hypothetical protein
MKSSGLCRIALLAVGELAGQRGDVERAFAAGQLARLACGFAGGGGFDDLADQDLLRLGRMLLEPVAERLDHRFHDRADFGGNELVLGLRGEFRVRHLDRQHTGQALAACRRR